MRGWSRYAESVGDSKTGHYNAMKELDILPPNWNAGKFKTDGKPYYWESGKPSVITLTKPLMKTYVFSKWEIHRNIVNGDQEEMRTVTRGTDGFPQWLEEILACTDPTKKFSLQPGFKKYRLRAPTVEKYSHRRDVRRITEDFAIRHGSRKYSDSCPDNKVYTRRRLVGSQPVLRAPGPDRARTWRRQRERRD